MSKSLRDELATVVGAAHVIEDISITASYSRDITDRYGVPPLLVVRPADTSEVSGVIAICSRLGAPIVVQGGNTGLVGGGVPRAGELLVSLSRLKRIDPVDAKSSSVVVGAGVVLSDLQAHAAMAGMEVPVDHGGRAGATIGGMVATNAGGVYAMRHGMTRQHVRGIEFVTADGTVFDRTTGPPKDNTGLDLGGLLIGSEGILAIITTIRLGLLPAARQRVAALVGLADLGSCLDLMSVLRRTVPNLEAVEFWEESSMRSALHDRAGVEPEIPSSPLYVLVQAAGAADPTDALAAGLEEAGVDLTRALIADTTRTRSELWWYREVIPEWLNSHQPVKFDVSIPLDHLQAFVTGLRDLEARESDFEVHFFGHLADGNVHVNVIGDSAARHGEQIFRHVVDNSGSISAEHGIGLAKAAYLTWVRTPAEIELMWSLKRAFDPKGILNPGRILGDAPMGDIHDQVTI